MIQRWSELHRLKGNLRTLILYYNLSLDFINLESTFPKTLLGCGTALPQDVWVDNTKTWQKPESDIFQFFKKDQQQHGLEEGERGDGKSRPNGEAWDAVSILHSLWHSFLLAPLPDVISQRKDWPEPSQTSAIKVALDSCSAHSQHPSCRKEPCKPWVPMQEVHYFSLLHLLPLCGRTLARFLSRPYWHTDKERENTSLDE